MTDLVIRFVAAGAIVSAFAMLGEVFRPKRFAGLFGAAPSVAMASLTITLVKQSKAYAAGEAYSMTAGALAFVVYA